MNNLDVNSRPPGKPGQRGRVRLGATVWTLVLLLMAGSYIYIAFVYPNRDIGPEQPIPFSHRLHAGVKGIDCRFCHPFVARSASAGIPEVDKCLYCHRYIIPHHPEIRKEHWHYDNDVPIPWVRLFIAEDHVKFRHQPHILKGFDCTECHGDVKTMDRLPFRNFEMGFCITCHRKHQANLSCWLGCHN